MGAGEGGEEAPEREHESIAGEIGSRNKCCRWILKIFSSLAERLSFSLTQGVLSSFPFSFFFFFFLPNRIPKSAPVGTCARGDAQRR